MFPVENPQLWFLILTAPLCFAAVWTDLKSMLIRNKTTYTLAILFLVVGAFILPWPDYGWRVLNGVIAFVIIVFLIETGRIGGGDGKFIAAAVPYITPSVDHLSFTLFMISSGFFAGLIVHRVARKLSFVRALAPDWKSWDHAGFPGGLVLGGTLFFYLLVTALLRAYGIL